MAECLRSTDCLLLPGPSHPECLSHHCLFIPKCSSLCSQHQTLRAGSPSYHARKTGVVWEVLNSFLISPDPQPPVFTSFQDYVTGLQTVISNAVDHIKGLEAHLIALKLEELTLEDTSISPVRHNEQTVCLLHRLKLSPEDQSVNVQFITLRFYTLPSLS